MRARIRTVKPEFFKHESLFDLETNTGLPMRLAFEGLWIVTDREGRFQWRPRTIKSEILPYDQVDMAEILNHLASNKFVIQYEVDGELFGWIPSFDKHQFINNRESESELPCPSTGKILSCDPAKFTDLWNAWCTRHERVNHASVTALGSAQVEGNGTERKGTLEEEGAAPQVAAEPSAAEAIASKGEASRAVLGQDQNSNVGRALAAVPDEVINDWRNRYTDESLKTTLKKVVNKITAKEGGFAKVKAWPTRLASCIENERESLVRRPPPKLKEPPPPPEFFETEQLTPESLAAAAKKGFKLPADIAAKLAAKKAMPGKAVS